MKVLDLFCGTKSIANAFKQKGHEVFSVDWDKRFNPSLCADIGKLTAKDIIKLCGGVPDVIWASPDCTTYSIAAISKHRRKEENGNLTPISEYAISCDEVNEHLINLIKELNPKYYFIENPRAGMRKMHFMKGLPRYTVTYCQYGDTRMKPTDIWTNHPNPQFKPPCKNGDSCHIAAPRGATTGTQGLKNKIEKAKIPVLLCQHIVDICESKRKEQKEMELKIYSPTEDGFIQKIEWNFEELKTEIAEKVEHYKNLVYTDDQMKTAKSDRANLRKFVDALETKRKEIKKQCLAPYEDFEKQMKALVAIVNEPIDLIDGQVREFENGKREEKRVYLESFFRGYSSLEWLNFEQIFDEKWLNASVRTEKAIEEMQARIEQIKTDLTTLSNLPEFSFEATEVYKQSLDINKAINEGQKLLEMQKRKAELEAAEIKPTASPAEELPQCPSPDADKQWISFKALLTVEEALDLREFFKSRNIEFSRI